MNSGPLAIVSVLAVLLGGAVYLGSLSGGYVYDDVRFVQKNPAVTEGVPFADYFRDPATQAGDASYAGIWRPLRTLSFRGVRLVLGAGPGPQRAVNLALHLVNGLLVLGLLRRLLGRGREVAALVGALAFVLHPLATEPVAWISGRGDLLAAGGVVAAAWLHLRGSRGATVLGLAAFALALLAKESAAVLPLLLVILTGYRGGWKRIRARLPALAAYAGVLVVWLGARSLVLGAEFGQGGGRALPPEVLATSLPGAGLYYLRTLLLPAGLSFELHLTPATRAPLLPLAGVAAGLGLAVLAWRFRRRAPIVTLAILWFAAALVPVTAAQLLVPLKILVANRFAYIGLVGGALLLGWIASRDRRCVALSAVVLVAFVPLAVARASVWRSPESLWSDVVAKDPENATALYGLGLVRAREGRWTKAADLLRRSAARDPRHPGVAVALGESLEHLASAAPDGSDVEFSYVRMALDAYHAAIRTWQGGATEERRLYRLTLANAAWLALVTGRLDLASDHVESLLASDEALPSRGDARDLFVRRLTALARQFRAGGVTESADDLDALRDEITRGGDR